MIDTSRDGHRTKKLEFVSSKVRVHLENAKFVSSRVRVHSKIQSSLVLEFEFAQKFKVR